MSETERMAALRRLLDRAGFTDAVIGSAGHDRSIAVIGGVLPERLPELAQLAPDIRAVGFRYVTLELDERAA